MTDSPLMKLVAEKHEERTGHPAEMRLEDLGDSEHLIFDCCKS